MNSWGWWWVMRVWSLRHGVPPCLAWLFSSIFHGNLIQYITKLLSRVIDQYLCSLTITIKILSTQSPSIYTAAAAGSETFKIIRQQQSCFSTSFFRSCEDRWWHFCQKKTEREKRTAFIHLIHSKECSNCDQGWIFWPSLLKSVSGVEISTEREFTLNFFVCGPISTQFFSAES